MFRQALFALTVTLLSGMVARADTIGQGAAPPPNGFMYSDSASPFEAFDWTALDLAAFAAYGGDFANVRRPVNPALFFEDPLLIPREPAADDEQPELAAMVSRGYFDTSSDAFLSEQSLAVTDESDVPEPGTLLLVGLGLLGASRRLRRAYAER